jgi:hypothetical protein
MFASASLRLHSAVQAAQVPTEARLDAGRARASAVPQGSAHVYFLGTRFEPNERPVDKSRRLW